MGLTLEPRPLPLQVDGDSLRVGSTRVLLETVVISYKLGASADEIVYQYPTLELADVHSVISYYLNNQAQVEEYVTG